MQNADTIEPATADGSPPSNASGGAGDGGDGDGVEAVATNQDVAGAGAGAVDEEQQGVGGGGGQQQQQQEAYAKFQIKPHYDEDSIVRLDEEFGMRCRMIRGLGHDIPYMPGITSKAIAALRVGERSLNLRCASIVHHLERQH